MPYKDAPWTCLADGKISKLLMTELSERLDCLTNNQDWCIIFENNSILKELNSLIEMIFDLTAYYYEYERRLFGSVEAIKTEPEWLLVSRLAGELLGAIGVNLHECSYNIPNLLTGIE